jgi:ABC-type spermidine/putrescine transport system permease subunit I
VNDKEFFTAWLEQINSHIAELPWYLDLTWHKVLVTFIATTLILIVSYILITFYRDYKCRYRALLLFLIMVSMSFYVLALINFCTLAIYKLGIFKAYTNVELLRDITIINTKYKVNISQKQIKEAKNIIAYRCNNKRSQKVCAVDSPLLKYSINEKISNPSLIHIY